MAALPALLCTILIFMDQQITAVIINRKEHKLKVRPAFIPFDSVLDVFCDVCGYPFFTTQQGILQLRLIKTIVHILNGNGK